MFRWLCNALAQGFCGADRTAPFAWPSDPADVEALITLAGHHLVTPALAFPLRGNGSVPHDARDYLAAAAYLNGERNALILDGLEAALATLEPHGIGVIALKGAANLLHGLYPEPSVRIVGDLDLLVAPEHARPASEALARAGFDEIGERRRRVPLRGHHHLPMQRHRQTGVGIEVHTTVLSAPYGPMLEPARVRRSARPVGFRGRELGLPSPTHRVLHNLVHDQLVDGAYARRSVSLRQLLDLALLCRREHAKIDWQEVAAAFARARFKALAYGLGVAQLLGVESPLGDLPDATRRLRRGIEHPRGHFAIKLEDAIRRFVRQPSTVANLLAPDAWPGRVREWRASARRPRG